MGLISQVDFSGADLRYVRAYRALKAVGCITILKMDGLKQVLSQTGTLFTVLQRMSALRGFGKLRCLSESCGVSATQDSSLSCSMYRLVTIASL